MDPPSTPSCSVQNRLVPFVLWKIKDDLSDSPLFLWDLGETYVLWEVPRRLCGSLRGEGDTMTSLPSPSERGVRFLAASEGKF